MAYTTINKSSEHFNTKLYTGNGSTQSITGVGFQPDWTWIKSRTTNGYHNVFDAVRGATKRIFTNDTQVEATTSTTLTSFDSDGFSLGSNGDVNGNSQSQVAWNWKANGAGSSNTDGSITSTVSANTTSGFSIVSYTGTGSVATVGHGLGAVPKMIFFKDRETSVDWGVYAEAIGNGNELYLSTTDSSGANSNAFNSTSPTSSVFTIGTSSRYNPSSKSVIAYCFAEKTGYSKFGSYTGNGSTDGAFVYTGFKPAFLMIKRTSGSDQWILYDTKRETGNVMNLALTPDSSDAEQDTSSYNTLDIVSNGFKCRGGSSGSGTGTNQSGGSYIYMAFAEAPLVGTNNVPCTAR
jgi:hypothetical protein